VGIDIVLRAPPRGCNKIESVSGKQIFMRQATKRSFVVIQEFGKSSARVRQEFGKSSACRVYASRNNEKEFEGAAFRRKSRVFSEAAGKRFLETEEWGPPAEKISRNLLLI
jgi:hypothetical protein